MFSCRFCEFASSRFDKKNKHRAIHRNVTSGYHCDYNKCLKVCPSESSLRLHLARVHNFKALSFVVSEPDIPENAFQCGVIFCKQMCPSFFNLKKHLQDHIKDNIEVPCPFKNCSKVYSSEISFKSHLSRSHRSIVNCQSVLQECVSTLALQDSISTPVLQESISTPDFEQNCGNANSHNPPPQLHDLSDEICDDSSDCESQTALTHSAALFYLKLESKHNVPSSTVQEIVKELKELGDMSKRNLEGKLTSCLNKLEPKPDNIFKIVEEMTNEGCSYLDHKNLSTIYLRKQYYKKNLSYTEPQQIPLYDVDGNQTGKFFHYVPILETIKNMFKDPNVKEQFENRPHISQPGVLKDFFDGTVFQENEFFKSNPDALPIILYEDAFEVSNPIGPAKGKHKIVAVYKLLGFCSPEWRSHVDNIQLVALCREKDLDRQQFYSPIIQDIKQLEDTGLEIYDGKTVKGTIVIICGDNLGIHGLVGLQENFSLAEFFCRYCLIVRSLFAPEFPFADRRTSEHFKEAILNLTEGNLEKYQGVKKSSPFHDLKYYHVSKGTPPCLAHDLLEGVVCFDLALFIKYFMQKKKWFDLNYLNKRIDTFKYSVLDRRDKPSTLKKNFVKIGGSASQVWSFIRLFPLLIANEIKDFSDEVWDLVLRLREIVLLVTAPAVKKANLGYLESQVLDYLDLRATLFRDVPLRPKHHYLQHYAELISEFGPLARVWTLRFESKHKRLKEIAQVSNNCINLTKTLSEKHEYGQSYLRAGASYRPPLISREIPFQCELFHENIQRAVGPIADQSLMQCGKATYNGVDYKIDDAVVLGIGDTCYDLYFGVIKLVLTSMNQSLFLVLEEKNAQYLPHLQIFEFRSTSGWKCVLVLDLLDYQPLHVYSHGTESCVALKHGIMLWR